MRNCTNNSSSRKLFEQDLDLAKRVQQAFLPSKHPDLAGFSFYHFYQPAQQIGGDYFDYIPLSDNRTAIIVADVVGHGVSAAMLMAKLSAETRFALASTRSVNHAITDLNRRICTLGVEKFITFLCLVLDAQTGNIEIVNAGHMAPLWRRDGKIEQPGEAESGVPLGIMEDYEYELSTIALSPGSDWSSTPTASMKLLTPTTTVRHSETGTDVDGCGTRRVRHRYQDDGCSDQIHRGTTQADDMCLLVVGRES